MQYHLFAENGRQRLLGQIVKGWAKAAGGDDDVSTVLCLADYALETRRIVTDNGLVEYIDAQLGQTLRNQLSIWASVLAMLPSRISVPTAISSAFNESSSSNQGNCYFN